MRDDLFGSCPRFRGPDRENGGKNGSVHRLAVAFGQVLRRAGLAVPTGTTVAYAEALAAVGLARPGGVYWAGRTTLVRRPEDVPVYDRAFAVFWCGVAATRLQVPPRPPPIDVELDVASRVLRWSPREVLRHKDLAACSPAELDQAYRLMSRLRVERAMRQSRRRRPSRSHRGRPDLRTTVRRALQTGGEVVRPATTCPGVRPRKLVLLIDVSGSMEPYARALLRFAHAAVAASRVEAFTLGTRVTRVSRELATHDPDRALAQAAAAIEDWAGGTRLGDDLRTFNDRWGVRGLARGAVVVVLSDGWDRGDPEVLAAEIARVRRVAYRLIWVNPLKATPGYAPLARGMATVLPYLDAFVEGHSIVSLEELVKVIRSR